MLAHANGKPVPTVPACASIDLIAHQAHKSAGVIIDLIAHQAHKSAGVIIDVIAHDYIGRASNRKTGSHFSGHASPPDHGEDQAMPPERVLEWGLMEHLGRPDTSVIPHESLS